jgi:HD-like signal output (HDOD) protein
VPVYKCRTLISTPHDLLRVAGRVPRLSSVYSRVKMLASRAEVPFLKIEREITRDAAICALLPRLARILYPALDRGAGTIGELLPILGGERIKHLLLITAAAVAFRRISSSQFDMRRFWRLSARRALLARQIALETPHVDPTRAFVAGLIGDVGHLVLHLGIPAPAQDAQARAVQSGMPVHEVEMALLGFDYTEVGAMLVRRWHHCPVIEHAIEYQMRPLNATDRRGDAGVLHIATRLAEAIEAGAALDDWSGSIRAAVWNMAGRTHARLAQIAARAGEDFEELAQALMQEVVLPELKSAASRPVQPANDMAVPIAHARAKQLLQMPAATQPFERKAG